MDSRNPPAEKSCTHEILLPKFRTKNAQTPPPIAPPEAMSSHVKFAQELMFQESDAIRLAAMRLGTEFDNAISILSACQGSVIVSGIGKSGLIGAKISATLASTGTPSTFMHATEAMHGDLGRVRKQDVVILISNSGNTEEVINLAAVLRQDSVKTIGITGNPDSRLADLCDALLNIGPMQEACPYNLAPTASTTTMLAIGDAIALTISKAQSFSEADFRKRHPGGILGKKSLPVRDILRFIVGKNTAVVDEAVTLRAMLNIAEKYPRRCGAVLITKDSKLTGIITDSDLRRLIVGHGAAILDARTSEVMTKKPVSANEDDIVANVLQIIRERRLDEIPIVNNEQKPIGVLDVQDLISQKILES